MYARALIFMALGVAVGCSGAAQAQTFPSKPVRIIVPFPPGGAADITSRILAEHMGKGLGQPVIVDNRPGAGAVIGYELGARAPGDGHTILVVFPSFVINPSVRRGLSYEPIKDFKAVGQTISLPMGIAIHPSLPAKSLKDLLALARARPAEIGYGTPGVATIQHVVGELMKLAVNVNLTHVPYQGSAPALIATAGGHIPMIIANIAEIAPFAKSGKVRALVVTTASRAEALPDVPTIGEAGYPALEATNWAGLVVPAATPASAIARLNTELVRALRNAEIQEKFKVHAMSPVPSTPEQFAALLQSESTRYTRVVREAGIKAD